MKIWTSAKSPKAVEYSMTYGLIVCVESLGIFLESIFAKVHQAGGNMRIPMAAWGLFSIDAGEKSNNNKNAVKQTENLSYSVFFNPEFRKRTAREAHG